METKKRMVEIERKFVIPNKRCEQRILDLGGDLNKVEEFTDWYYDTRDYKLIQKDRWLRKRSGKWQLKYPTVTKKPKGEFTSQYYETDKENEILHLLNEFIGRCFENIQYFIQSECQPIAAIRTRRKTYCLGKTLICLDTTEEMEIGEVEVVLEEEDGDVLEGLKLIDEVFSKLGVTATTEGKVERYFRTKKFDVYSRLVECGVFSSI